MKLYYAKEVMADALERVGRGNRGDEIRKIKIQMSRLEDEFDNLDIDLWASNKRSLPTNRVSRAHQINSETRILQQEMSLIDRRNDSSPRDLTRNVITGLRMPSNTQQKKAIRRYGR